MRVYGKEWGYNVYDCRYCLYWKGLRKGCVYEKDCCCDIPQTPPNKPPQPTVTVSECDNCPYGRDSPCLGWCTKEVMRAVGLHKEREIYEDASAKFELRASAQEQAFSTLRINNINFIPDAARMIPIDRFSYNYFLSNTLNNIKRRYEFFKKDGSPTLFKIQGNDTEYRARLIRSTILYTNVPYFAVVESRFSLPQTSYFPSDIEIYSTLRFETMSRSFIGQTLTIKNKTADIESLFLSWGYQVEASETLTLLWPPAAQINEVSAFYSDNAFLFSSFNLEPHGNINVHSTDIAKIGNGVSRVSIHSRVKVFRKNAEIVIDGGTTYLSAIMTLRF